MTALELSQLTQGSELWLQARCGLVTASRASDVIARLKKGGEAAPRVNYRHELIYERLTGQPYPQPDVKSLQWRLEQEPFARAAYELEKGVLVDTVGFVAHPDIACFGCSPDGLVGDEGLIEIKCPAITTHIGWMVGGTLPLDYCPQMLAQMSCTGRDWCDFVSYCPDLPLFVRRFFRDEKLIEALESEVVNFNRELESEMAALPQAPQSIAEVLEWPTIDEVKL